MNLGEIQSWWFYFPSPVNQIPVALFHIPYFPIQKYRRTVNFSFFTSLKYFLFSIVVLPDEVLEGKRPVTEEFL